MFRIAFPKKSKERLKGFFEKYRLEVGVLDDKLHKNAKRGVRGLKGQDVITAFAGGSRRMVSGTSSGKTISQVSQQFRRHLGFNYLLKPFKNKTRDINKLLNDFFKYAFGQSTQKRLENTLQAVIRNPILRKDYGGNSQLTAKIKGFNHLGVDTAQLFRNIRARVYKVK